MNQLIRKSFWKIGLMFLVVLGLTAGIALPAYAATNTPANGFQMIQGKVQSVSLPTATPPTFVVLTPNQGAVTVSSNSTTKFYLIPMGKAQGFVNSTVAQDNNKAEKAGKSLPPKAQDLKNAHIPANWRDNLGWLATFDRNASFSDIAVGDKVIVRADNNKVAQQVMIIKAPVNRTVAGAIALTADLKNITITPTGGTAVTLNVVDSTRIILKGQTTISGYGVALYNSITHNAIEVTVQATAPTPKGH